MISPSNPNTLQCATCRFGKVRKKGRHCSKHRVQPEYICTDFDHYRSHLKSHQKYLRREQPK